MGGKSGLATYNRRLKRPSTLGSSGLPPPPPGAALWAPRKGKSIGLPPPPARTDGADTPTLTTSSTLHSYFSNGDSKATTPSTAMSLNDVVGESFSAPASLVDDFPDGLVDSIPAFHDSKGRDSVNAQDTDESDSDHESRNSAVDPFAHKRR